MLNKILYKLETVLKELSIYEMKGLDTSSLKIFIKNYKGFIKINEQQSLFYNELSYENKLDIIRRFLEDKQVFAKISDVIKFANDKLGVEFKNQKESREVTISRIIGRINNNPELKDKLKYAVKTLRNEKVDTSSRSKSKKELISAEIFSRWADIIEKI